MTFFSGDYSNICYNSTKKKGYIRNDNSRRVQTCKFTVCDLVYRVVLCVYLTGGNLQIEFRRISTQRTSSPPVRTYIPRMHIQ